MKKLLFILFVLSSLSVVGQDFSIFEKKEFVGKDGQKLPYRILYPENYDRSQKYPLVLFLHGGGERGNDNEKQLVHGVKTFLDADARKKFPCIVIAPQCPQDSYWSSAKFERTKYPIDFDFNYGYEITAGLKLAAQLTKSIVKNYSVVNKRLYVTGLYMGGMG